MQLLQGKLALLVHNEAVQRQPADAQLRASMLHIVNDIRIVAQEQLARSIAQRFADDFADDPDGCCTLAACIEAGVAPAFGSGAAAAGNFLVQAVQRAGSAAMQRAAAAHVTAQLAGAADDAQTGPDSAAQPQEPPPSASSDLAETWLHALHAIAACELDGNALSCDALCWQCEALTRCGSFGAAQARLNTALRQQPTSLALWQLALRLHTMQLSASSTALGANESAPLTEPQQQGSTHSSASSSRQDGRGAHSLVAEALAAVAPGDAAHLVAPAAAALQAAQASLQPAVVAAARLLQHSSRSGEQQEALSRAAAALYHTSWCVFQACGARRLRCPHVTVHAHIHASF